MDEKVPEVNEGEIRTQIIAEFGFNEADDKEMIDKAVAREVGIRKDLSSAIGQKIKYRTDLEAYKAAHPETAAPSKTKEDEEADLGERISAGVKAGLDQTFLDESGYPDEIKQVIKNVAAANKISFKEAAKDPYAASKIETWSKTQEGNEAAISRTDRQNGGAGGGDDFGTPPDVDLSTEEGRKTYDEWKAGAIAQEIAASKD